MTGALWAEPPETDDQRSYLVADVFTDTPLKGNQLGVFLDARGLTTDLMQRTYVGGYTVVVATGEYRLS